MRMTVAMPLAGATAFRAQGSGTTLTIAEKLAQDVNVHDYGAVGDGATDDTDAVRAAALAVADAGGGVVKFDGRLTYKIQDCDLADIDNVTFDGNGCRIVQPSGNYTFVHGLTEDIDDLTYATITGDLARGATAVTATSAAVAGDYVYVRTRQTVTGGSYEPVAEINKVVSNTAGTITLEWPLAKVYANDSVAVHGIGVCNDMIRHNITFKNFRFISATRRTFQLLYMLGLTIEDCEGVDLPGFIVCRGRFVNIRRNKCVIAPAWAGGYRPYTLGMDAGTCDVVVDGNFFRSRGHGIVHFHEGCANVKIVNNTFANAVADTATAEVWGAISLKSLSWNVQILNNTIINGPRGGGIDSTASSKYSGEGNVALRVAGNIFLGAFNTSCIIHAASQPKADIVNNDTTGATPTNYELNIGAASSVIAGNKIGDSAKVSITDSPGVSGNVGYQTFDLFLNPNDFIANTGSPVMTLFRGNRGKCWALDASADESVSTSVEVPAWATSLAIHIDHTNLGAGSGNVVWLVQYGGFADAADTNVADSSAGGTIAAPAQDVLKKTVQVATGLTVVGGTRLFLRLGRTGSSGSDTLANDCGLIGARLRFS